MKPNYFKRLTEIGYLPDDSEDEKVNKSSLTILSLPFALAGLIWGLLYFLNGLTLPGWIPFSYGILSVLSFINFSITKKYKFFRNSQLFLILILPFLLQLSLGGFIPSSAVIMWALISPVGALVFFKTKQSIGWFVAYVILVIVAFFINDFVTGFFSWGLSDRFINIVFLLNIIAVSGLIYAIQYYYVGKQTELKESIEEKNSALEEQTEKLKEMDETKSRFFANISHEFRTPLTLILGLVNKQISNSEVPPNIQDSETMKRNANRLLQLINQLLDLSKLESGELQLEVAHDDICHFIKRIIFQFESLANDKNIVISLNGKQLIQDHDLEKIELYFDHDKIQKIITNLVSNAIKFADNKSEIKVKIDADNDFVHIKVANTGEGISDDNLPNVFDRFYQVDTGSTRQYEGTGIGLALVKELVELHHGSVKAESSSKVTIFTISLPLNESVFADHEKVKLSVNMDVNMEKYDSVEKTSKFPDNEVETSNDQLQILIVEDNSDLRNYISEILEKDYSVIQAVDGLDGLEQAESSIPDLITGNIINSKSFSTK
jgi:signal transduction histidine kinase